MKKVVFQMEEFSCPTCITRISSSLLKVPGVKDAKVWFYSCKVRAEFDEAAVSVDGLQAILTDLGYCVLSKRLG